MFVIILKQYKHSSASITARRFQALNIILMNYQSVELFVDDNEYSELLRALILTSPRRGMTVSATGCGFDPLSRKFNIYLNTRFSLWCEDEARR